MSISSGGMPEPLENLLFLLCMFGVWAGLDHVVRTVRQPFLLCMFRGWAGFGGKGLKFESRRSFSNKSLPQLQRIESVSFASFWQPCP